MIKSSGSENSAASRLQGHPDYTPETAALRPTKGPQSEARLVRSKAIDLKYKTKTAHDFNLILHTHKFITGSSPLTEGIQKTSPGSKVQWAQHKTLKPILIYKEILCYYTLQVHFYYACTVCIAGLGPFFYCTFLVLFLEAMR